jgi:peptidoglycan/xylan/chitin deacetylase (PgdA/CDA1 family)
MGFEIGNHTGHHIGVYKLSREELVEEIEFIERRCAAHNIRHPETFCYPGGAEHPAALPVLREKGYRMARGCGNRPYLPDRDDPLLIPSFVITGKNEADFVETISLARPGEIIVLTLHGVPDYNHPWVDTSPEIFGRMMKHLSDSRVKVIAMRDIPLPAYLPSSVRNGAAGSPSLL